jgi:hypothetical protein
MTNGATVQTDAEAPEGSYQPAQATELNIDTGDAGSFRRHIWIHEGMRIAADRRTPKQLDFRIDLGRLSRRRHMLKMNRTGRESEDS